MKNFKIGGVPEHFNYPWYLALKNKLFQQQDINLRWVDFHGGTGQMNNALRKKEIDLAVILTEGIVRDIVLGNPSKIVQVFVKSPLIWGIHVAENSEYQTVNELKGTSAAISRYGSGSHLMAYINAKNQNWNIQNDLKFKVVNDLEGALNGLPNGKGDYFMWEKFTTKPFVDEGVFRRLGNCPTPWPCFVIAVRNEILDSDPESIQAILEVINSVTKDFKQIEDIDKKLADRYGQKIEDVWEWLSITEWSSQQLGINDLMEVQHRLFDLELIDKKVEPDRVLHLQ